jgi:hypothetical protein
MHLIPPDGQTERNDSRLTRNSTSSLFYIVKVTPLSAPFLM